MLGDSDPGRDDQEEEKGEAAVNPPGDLFGDATETADLDGLLEDLIGGPIKTIVIDNDHHQCSTGGMSDKIVVSSKKRKSIGDASRETSSTITAGDGDNAHKTSSNMNDSRDPVEAVSGVLQNGAMNEVHGITDMTHNTITIQASIPIVPNALAKLENSKVKVEVLKKRKFVIA